MSELPASTEPVSADLESLPPGASGGSGKGSGDIRARAAALAVGVLVGMGIGVGIGMGIGNAVRKRMDHLSFRY